MPLPCWIEPDRVQDVAATFAAELQRAGGLAPGQALLHGWIPRPTMLFTRRDERAPGFGRACEDAAAHGYAPVVRASGGEVVPLDPGTACVDLLLPGEALALRAAFSATAAALVAAAERLGLHAAVGRVAGAYCPGEFDVAVGGRKFAGLAQRRTAAAVAVHSFVLVAGPGRPRALLAARAGALLRGEAAPPEDGAARYPVASLGEAAGEDIPPRAFLTALAAAAADVPHPLSESGARLT